MSINREKRPVRLYRWTSRSFPMPQRWMLRYSAWSRGRLAVLSTLDKTPSGTEWRVSISLDGHPPDDATCREVLAEFDMNTAREDSEAEAHARAELGRAAMARHFILPVLPC